MCTFLKFLSVFSPNAGKYGPEKTPYLDTFQAVNSFHDLMIHTTFLEDFYCAKLKGRVQSPLKYSEPRSSTVLFSTNIRIIKEQ